MALPGGAPARPGRSAGGGYSRGLTLGHYLQPVEFTGRLPRRGKAAIGAELATVFKRLQSSASAWQSRLEKLRGGKLFGRYAAAHRETLRALAVRRLANLQATSPT